MNKKCITLVLTAAMLVPNTAMNTSAAVSVKLSKTKCTLKVGKSTTIRVKKAKNVKVLRVSYKAPNKVVTVSKKGKVTAKKAGTCNVRVYVTFRRKLNRKKWGKAIRKTMIFKVKSVKVKTTEEEPIDVPEITPTEEPPTTEPTASTTPTIEPSADPSTSGAISTATPETSDTPGVTEPDFRGGIFVAGNSYYGLQQSIDYTEVDSAIALLAANKDSKVEYWVDTSGTDKSLSETELVKKEWKEYPGSLHLVSEYSVVYARFTTNAGTYYVCSQGIKLKGVRPDETPVPTTGSSISTGSSIVVPNEWSALELYLNGGSYDGQLVYTSDSKPFLLGTPKKEGYDFVGWNDGDTVSKSVLINPTTKVPKYYAVWSPHTYSIVYETDGGVLTNESITSYTPDSENFSLPTASKEGYVFSGWQVGNKVNTNFVIEKGTIGDITAKTLWTPKKYNISLTGFSDISYTIETDNFLLPHPTKKGYTFVGWSDGESVEEYRTISKGTIGNLSFEAIWKLDKYAITYVLNGGSISDAPTEYSVMDVPNIPEPTKEGSTFVGWINGNVISKTIDISSICADVTLTAVWE